jgi:hypothetical protein
VALPTTTAVPHVVVSGSMRAADAMEHVGRALRELGCAATLPRPTPAGVEVAHLDDASRRALKRAFIEEHLAAIRTADLVLIVNVDLDGVVGYVGASALVEAAFAFALGRPLALLHPLGPQPAGEELLALGPEVLDGCLERVPDLVRANRAAPNAARRP